MDLGIFFAVIVIALLTVGSGFFSASEAALFSLSSMKIKAYQSSKNPRQRMIAELVLHPRNLLVTIFMLNTLVNVLLQNATAHSVGNEAGWGYTVGIPLLLTLVFGEVIPKHLGLVNNVSIANYVAPVIYVLQKLLAPIRDVIVAITAPISRVMFFFLKKDATISKEELQHVLKTSEKTGVLHSDETELIDGFLSLQESQVKEVMRPREEILLYDINEPLSKLIHLIVDQECTRVPTCNKNIENMLGIISANGFFLHRDEINNPQDVVKFLEKPFYIPETTSARLLLRRLDENREEMAIVVDEYGSISGLITYEDLIETVIGEITDRRDQNLRYTRSSDTVIIASGKMELQDFEEIFGVELVSPNNMVTLGGWLTEQLGDIPKIGTKYQTNEFLFQVLAAEPHRITRIYVRKLASVETAKKEGPKA